MRGDGDTSEATVIARAAPTPAATTKTLMVAMPLCCVGWYIISVRPSRSGSHVRNQDSQVLATAKN